MRRLIIVIVIIGLLGGAYYVGTSVLNPSKPSAVPTSTPTGAQKAAAEVVAEAAVMPVRFAEVNWATQGLVSEVLVAEGDKVTAGQVLARVDAKRQTAAVSQAEAVLAKAQGAKASAEASLAKAQAALALLKAGPRDEDVAVARAALSVSQATLARIQDGADTTALAEAKANMDKAARAVQQAQFNYDRVKDSPFGTIGPEALRLEQTTIDYDLAKTTYEQLVLGPRDVEVNVAKAQVAQAAAALSQAQAGPRPEQIAVSEADVAAADAALKNTDSDVASAEAALAEAKAALADTELHAPFGGTLTTLNVKAGEPVPAATFAARIADLSGWQFETKDLTELNVSNLKVGSPAVVKFDAVPDLTLNGKVTRINDYGTNRQGDIVYMVVVTPDKLDPRLKWNMTASVTIQPE
jgi:HlyD family secretion protein